MSKVVLKGFIKVPQEDLATVLKELPNHIALTRKESGCVVFNVAQVEGDDHTFNVYEEFNDKASFEQHQKRVRTSKWGSITRNVQRHYEIEGA